MKSIEQQYQDEIDELKHDHSILLKRIITGWDHDSPPIKDTIEEIRSMLGLSK